MKELGRYEIGGGTGDIIEEAYLGDWDDFRNFVEDAKVSIAGYVYESDEYTLAWHNGKFFYLYSHEDEDRNIIWYEEQDDETVIFGIYTK